MSNVDLATMQKAVLDRLKSKWDSMPEYQRNLKLYAFQVGGMGTVTRSPTELIKEVEDLTDIGKTYIAAEFSKMQKIQ